MKMKRIWIAGTGALLIGAVAACKEAPKPVELQARIAGVTGTVAVNGQPVQVGHVMKHGDRLTTGADGSADLIVHKRGGLTLRENAELTLDFQTGSTGLHLKSGELLASFHKVAANQDVSVVTPTTIAGVRGTHFFMKVHHDDHVYVCTCNGRVHYQGHGHPEGEVTEAVHHEAYEFKRENGKVVRSESGMLHHEDHHMQRNAGLIEKEINWDKLH